MIRKIKIFRNKGYCFINCFHDVTRKTPWREWNHNADDQWPLYDQRFENKSYYSLSFIKFWLEKKVFERYYWFKFNNLELTLAIALKVHTSVRKLLGLVPTFWEDMGYLFCKNDIWNFIKIGKESDGKGFLLLWSIYFKVYWFYKILPSVPKFVR